MYIFFCIVSFLYKKHISTRFFIHLTSTSFPKKSQVDLSCRLTNTNCQVTKLRLLSSSGKVVRRVWEAQWHSVLAEKCFVGDRHFVVWGWWCFGWIRFWLGMMFFWFFGWIFWLGMMILCFFLLDFLVGDDDILVGDDFFWTKMMFWLGMMFGVLVGEIGVFLECGDDVSLSCSCFLREHDFFWVESGR